jgi:two-component system response regulator HydG
MRRMAVNDRVLTFSRGEKGPRVPESGQFITQDPVFRGLLNKLPLYAASDLPVLLCGEPGTGKELVAEALWALSPRWRQRFNRLNCATLVESLACSELFGHVRGSFTDACQSRPGKFKLAHGGTLFLDEVADLPLTVQPRLLRAVEQGEIEPVGTDAPIRVDVRLLAATNQDLASKVAQGRFRRDLYDRLAVLVVNLPPLRNRGEDILVLAEYFLDENAHRYGRPLAGFTPAALRRLREHFWPGNIRELKNVITRAVILSSGPYIRERDLTIHTVVYSGFTLPCPEGQMRPARIRLEELFREERGNVSAMARRLQVCSKTVYRWFRSYRIDLMQLRGMALGIAFFVVFTLALEKTISIDF